MSSRCRPELLLVAVALLGCDTDFRLDLAPQKPEPTPVEIDEDDNGPDKKKPVPAPKKGIVDLGTAEYPAKPKSKGAVAYTFSVPPNHRLAYRLGDAERKAIEAFYANYAKSVQYKRIGPKTFQWSPPPGCPSDMSCVYKKLIARTHDEVFVLAQRLSKRATDAKLNASQLAQIALAYVQAIPYQIPDEPFGLLPPPLVVTNQRGDCDSKALLLYMLLNMNGVETVILSSKAHKHSMAGIAIPTEGTSFRWNNRRYAFAEVTAKGAPLGFMPPEVTSPNDWVVELSP